MFGVLLVSDCGRVISGQIFASRSSSEYFRAVLIISKPFARFKPP